MNGDYDNVDRMAHKQEKYIHEPVLAEAVEKFARLNKGDTVVDCTLGLGGHSEIFLRQIGKNGTLIAFEQDSENLKSAKARLKKYKDQITFIHTNFVHLQKEIRNRNVSGIKLVFFDLGLSSPQVDDPKRGFSFLNDGPLDMRFDKKNPLTAEKVINKYSEKRLEKIFREYGEERYSKRFARIIKENLPIKSTVELADLIKEKAPKAPGRRGKQRKLTHPATKIFQALRIEVNDELEVLKSALRQALDILEEGGMLMVISYHSLEDRIVKRFMKHAAKECICPHEIPVCLCNHKPELVIETKKPIVPDEKEIEANRRARSAKLRIGTSINDNSNNNNNNNLE